ncbi:MAG TPA: glycosyltransferase [Deltaproteobacteria bacterium]|nr:glycosyltransferase [Deltaproteobacteria bacterium]
MNILIFTSLITDACLERRDNREYISFAGRKKIRLLCRSLESLGHTVDVCSTSYAKSINKTFVEKISRKVRIIHAPSIGFFGRMSFLKRPVGLAFNLYWICRHFRKYDLVVFYNYHKEYFLPALLGKKWFGLPILMDYEDGLFLDKGYQSSLYRYIEKTAYRETEGFFLVNGSLRERLRIYGQDHKPSLVVNGFLDTELLESNREWKPGAMKELAFTGNFSGSFGFEELLQYVQYLPENFRLTITGQADPEEEKALIDATKGRSNVCFMGRMDSARFEQVFEKIEICILLNSAASGWNKTNFPSKLFDYLSRNRFVLSTCNPVLKPYYGLSNFVLLEDFPGGLEKLEQVMKKRAPNPRELFSLHAETLKSLELFIEKLVS